MKRLTQSRLVLLAAFLISFPHLALAIDGTWTQPLNGNQDWGNTANWFNGIIADGPDASAVFNVDLPNDQTITNAFGKTVGHFYFQDSATGTAGGYNVGLASEVGTLTLDVTAGRSIFNVGALNTGSGKKVSVLLPLVNNDGILKVNSGQLSLRANSPGLTSDFLSVGGLTDTRSLLSGVPTVRLVGGASFQADFANNTNANFNNLLNPAATITLGGTILAPPVAFPPALPVTVGIPIDGGGAVIVTGRAANTNSQTVAGVTFNRGSHSITVNNAGANSSATFDPTTFTRNPGAIVNFVNGGAGTSVLLAGGLVNNANGIIGGYAISGTNWATVSGGGTIVGLTSYQTSLDPTTWLATDNVSLSTNALAPIGTRTINTLRLTAGSTNSIGSGNTLTLADGGLLVSAGAAQINDGTLRGPAGGELILHQVSGTAGAIGSVIADNGSASTLIKSGTGTLMLTGTNANTYTGGTYVNQGILQIGDGLAGGNSQSLGSGNITLFGTLQINKTNDLTLANSISGSGLLIKAGSGMLTLSGNNTQNGNNPSAPGLTASGVNGALGFTATRIDAGTLAVATDNSIGGVIRFAVANTTLRSADANTRTLNNDVDVANSCVMGSPGSGNLVFKGVLDTGNGAKVFTISNALTTFDGPMRQGAAPAANTLGKAGPGTLLLNVTTNQITKPFVITGGILKINDEGCLGINPPAFTAGQLNLNGGALETTATMTLDDPNRGITVGAAGGTFNVDGGTTLSISAANIISGTGGTLIKAGTGTLLLSGSHLYTGSTIINAGRLQLDSTASLASSPLLTTGPGGVFDVSAIGGFTLAAGQTLGGSGGVVGNVNGSGTSTISPGSSPGTLTFSNDLSLASGDVLVFDLTNNVTIGSGVNDLLVVNGNLNLNNNLVTIRPIAPGGVLANGTYRLVNYVGTKTGSLSINPGSRFSLTLDESVPNQINLNVTGLPGSLVWKGNNGPSWDVGTTPNWLNGVNPDVFFNFDTVAFNDTASSFSVSIDATVFPNVVTINANSDYTFNGLGGISGTTGLSKSGNGKAILANFGTNNYTGTTAISAGTLQIGQNDGSGSIGSGPIVNDGTLRFQNASVPITISNLSGAGVLIAEGVNQDLILSASNTYSGPTIVSTNARLALYATSGSSFGSLGTTPGVTVLSDGALYNTLAGAFSTPLTLSGDGFAGEASGALRAGTANQAWTGPITLALDASIGNDGGTLTLSNSISGGAFALTKVGVGTLVLANNNTYGNTAVLEGTLQIGNGGVLGSLGTGPVTVNTALVINRSDNLTIANQIVGTGGIAKQGNNTLTLTGNNTHDATTSTLQSGGAPGFTGTRLEAGTLAIGSDSALGTGLFRAHAAGVILRAADANPRIVSCPLDVASDFVIGSIDTGDLTFNNVVYTGNAAKTFTISNNVTTFNGEVMGGANNNNITKAGPGTLVLNGQNTYGKPTVVAAGKLIVNGLIGSNTVTVTSGTLGGTGVITSPLFVQAAGTLAPGASIGTLSVSNNVTLAGTNLMEVNATSLASDRVQGITNLTYGGTLRLVNLGGAFAVGNSFKLFDAEVYTGAFATIEPAAPAPGLAWDTSSLAANGTLKVAASVTGPHFNSPLLSGGNLILSGSGGTPGNNYYVLASTNVALPITNWTSLETNQFDINGNFSFTNIISAGFPQRFFLIQVP